MKGIITAVCLSLMVGSNVIAQSNKKRELGLRVAYGIKNEHLPEGKEYKPILVLPYYNYYLTREEKRARFSTFVEGQLGAIVIDHDGRDKKSAEWELGFNVGPAFSYRIGCFVPYVGAAYGANVITVDTEKQADGLIFAATSFTGIKTRIKNDVYGDVHFRLRHISNGGMKKPNFGIDTVLLGAGISKLF